MIDKLSTSSTVVNEDTLGKYQCDFCGRYLKSGAGRASHMRKCTQRNLSDQVNNSAVVNSDKSTANSNSDNRSIVNSTETNVDSVVISANATGNNSTGNSACVNSIERLTESDPLE